MGTKIARILKARKITQKSVADAMGVTNQAVNLWCKGGNPSPEMLTKLAAYLNLPEEDLYGDDLEPQIPIGPLPEGSWVGNGGAYYSVPTLQTPDKAWNKAGAFFERFILTPGACAVLSTTGANPAMLEYMVPSDDSMEPTLTKNSLCIIDRSQTDVVREGIYCFLTNSRVILRRAVIDLETSAVTLVPDNPRYPRIPRISRSARERIQCLGRVVYKLDGQPL